MSSVPPILDLHALNAIRAVETDNDRFVRELYRVFVEQCESTIEKLVMALEKRDLLAANRSAHLLRGSAANVGASALAEAAAAIEKATGEDFVDLVPLKAAVMHLKSLFAETQSQLKSMALIS